MAIQNPELAIDHGLTWTYRLLGEAGLLLEARPANDAANRAVQMLALALDRLGLPGVLSSVPAINTLLISFDPLQVPLDQLQDQTQRLVAQLDLARAAPPRVLTIPVRYGGADGPDLDEVAAQLGLAPRDVVAEHCAHIYRVLMIGFAPGFPYLGGLPERLHLPRRTTPRAAVPAGSVAIAAGMTGIYPARLPGGWHLIGRSDLRLFDPGAAPPSILEPGDGVRFVALPDGVSP